MPTFLYILTFFIVTSLLRYSLYYQNNRRSILWLCSLTLIYMHTLLSFFSFTLVSCCKTNQPTSQKSKCINFAIKLLQINIMYRKPPHAIWLTPNYLYSEDPDSSPKDNSVLTASIFWNTRHKTIMVSQYLHLDTVSSWKDGAKGTTECDLIPTNWSNY